MNLLTIGLHHHSTPPDLRARFALSLDQLQPSLPGLRQRWQRGSHHPEVALLSTASRTELHCAAVGEMRRPAVEWLAGLAGVTVRTLMDHAYVLEGGASARNVFRVASGLDSTALGEPHILGQMQRARRQASSAGTLGGTLQQLFERAFFIARTVRGHTAVGNRAADIAVACARLARQMTGGLGDSSVLFVGAGDMIEQLAGHFLPLAPRRMAVANRGLRRAHVLATRVGAESLALPDMPARLSEFDLVVSCTAASGALIDQAMVARALQAREGRGMWLFDMAEPHDIDDGVRLLPGVRLIRLDDLASLIRVEGPLHPAAVHQAEALVETGVRQFESWLAQRGAVPLIQALHAQTNQWRDAELLRARRALARGDDVDGVLETLSRGLTRKILHGALTQLREPPGTRPGDMPGTVSRLFLRCPVDATSRLQPARSAEPPEGAPFPVDQP